jgi:hypothetical protein
MERFLSAWVAVARRDRVVVPLQFTSTALPLAAFLALAPISPLAAATLSQRIDPPQVNVGDQATVTITVQNGTMGDFHLPPVDGLQALPGMTSTTNISYNNGALSSSESESVRLAPTRPGDFTIPAFDVPLRQGGVLRTQPIKLHVIDNGISTSATSPPTSSAPAPPPAAKPAVDAPFTPNGPVVMPPANPAATSTPANGNSTNSNVPRDKDGGPAKVFIVITPETTDAYVGQAIPMQIDFYIRLDVNAEQNSLPTIKGSDFLMNSFTHRGSETVGMLEGQQYLQETWRTAIAAPKSGDFPLAMERDTYWIKSITNNGYDPFSGFSNRRANLAHEQIGSNRLIVHVHELPAEGRPAHFTGAIGQFNVTGEAQPDSVEIGEPVTLRFVVRGEGNFDYVRCPALTDDTEWKTYVPRSGVNYLDEAHTQAVKIFEQSVIPLKNGNVPLPAASFSYFDPAAKQYVTIPIALPEITVTGTPPPLASASPDGGTGSAATPETPSPAELLPNRVEIGSLRTTLTPVYRQTWFWAVQGVLLSLPLLGAIFLALHSRSAADDGLTERTRHQRALRLEEDAMADAVRRDDAPAFFVAARHAIQLQLGARWTVRPEALTLGEIRSRDPQLAATLEPLFKQADEVIYSGRATPGLALAEWEQGVRAELRPLQPA